MSRTREEYLRTLADIDIPESLKELMASLQEVKSLGWSQLLSGLEEKVSFAKEKDLKSILTDQSLYNLAFHGTTSYSSRVDTWLSRRVVSHLLSLYPEMGDDVLAESEIDFIKCMVLEDGIYKDVSRIDEVAKDGSGESQVVAANYCSIEVLRTLKGHKNSKIRKIYYARIGPVECLDEMLSDRLADIRCDGITRAPFAYEKLNNLTKEIARAPFTVLVEKISFEYLPMLLANRNIKNSWISKIIERRMNLGR
jgi:hypothetical protein